MKKKKKIVGGCLISVIAVIVVLVLSTVRFVHSMKTNALLEESWDPADGLVLQNLKYGEGDLNTCDLYLPHQLEKGDTSLLMLFVHGGGWMSGDKDEFVYACRRYAKERYVTATMNYSLLRKEHPEITLQTMTDEIDECVNYLISECGRRGIALRSMVVSGSSAGGNLAMLYAYKYLPKLPISFIAIQVGPTDLNYLFRQAQDANQDSLRMFSPVCFVTPSAPPAILAYGEQDGIVPLEHPRRLVARYDSLGLQYRYIRFPHSGHMLEADPDSAQLYFDTIKKWARRSMQGEKI